MYVLFSFQSRPLNVEYLTMDASILLPPTGTPLTGIEFNKRLPCGEVERARRVSYCCLNFECVGKIWAGKMTTGQVRNFLANLSQSLQRSFYNSKQTFFHVLLQSVCKFKLKLAFNQISYECYGHEYQLHNLCFTNIVSLGM